MKPRLLDLFCGAGGAAMGYYRAGFEVVGVDNKPQPSYPFEFHQADAMAWPLAGFDVIHASPPCQRYSPISRYQRVAAHYDDLVEAVRERFLAVECPTVIENVIQAPIMHDRILCGLMFGLPILRHRAFEFSNWMPNPAPVHPEHGKAPRQSWSGYNRLPDLLTVVGHTYRLSDGRKAMEMPWAASREELNEAVPPAYTEWIGEQLRLEVRPQD